MNSWQKREKELKEKVCGHEFGKITQSNITCKLCGKQVHPYYYGYDTGLKDGKARMTQTIQKCRKLHEAEVFHLKGQIQQDYGIIDDIKHITGCKSNDGLEIVESVRNIKTQLTTLFEEIEKSIEEFFATDISTLAEQLSETKRENLLRFVEDIEIAESCKKELIKKIQDLKSS